MTQPRSSPPPVHKFRGCSSIRDYEVMSKLGEGTFGEVYKARSKRAGSVVALKKILMHNEKDGFPITALREIKLLKMLSHVNVLKLEEMAVERVKGEGRKKGIMYMVTPYMDHDLAGLLENPSVHFTEPQIKCYMLQLLEGLRYLHDSHILHRDMKAANLLINNKGILQIADFGLARHYEEPVPRPGEGGGEATHDYTTLVVTRWYRPPELLLQLRRYTTAIDMWGVGCVFGEMFKGKPILAGSSDINQAHLIFDLVGSPTEENMPGWSLLPGCDGVKAFEPRRGNLTQVFREQGSLVISLLSEFLKLDWRKRINAIDALKHPYFTSDPLPARPEDLPMFEESHELDRRKFRGKKAALPPAPAGGTVGMAANGEWVAGSGPPPPAGPPNGAPYANGAPSRASRAGPGPFDRGPPNGAYPPHRGPPSTFDKPPPYHHDDRGPGPRGPPPPPNRQAYQPPPRYHDQPRSRPPHNMYDDPPPLDGSGSRRPHGEGPPPLDGSGSRRPHGEGPSSLDGSGSKRPHGEGPLPPRPPRGQPKVDTYIPPYSSAAAGPPRPSYEHLSHPPDCRARDDLPPRRDELPPRRDDLPPRRDDLPPRRDDLPPRRDDLPPRRDERWEEREYRDRDRDRDRPEAERREYDGREYPRRSRTRSPEREREREHRERARERERELYRR